MHLEVRDNIHKDALIPFESGPTPGDHYHRYHIATASAPDIVSSPRRFNVKVSRPLLASHLVTEIVKEHNKAIITSRPCVYGVFSGPIGGFAPRPDKCVGCLRCMTEYPEMVRVTPNPARQTLGDSYLNPDQVDTLLYEARQGRVAVKGAGFRGRFGGDGWDAMWTDMSEIVRPTRDGIHGREYISTSVDIGSRPMHLTFGPLGEPEGEVPKTISLQVPFLLDIPPISAHSEALFGLYARCAREMRTLSVAPGGPFAERGPHVVPLVSSSGQFDRIGPDVVLIEVTSEELHGIAEQRFPDALVCLRVPLGENLHGHYQNGVRVFHLAADYQGRGPDGRFALELIREAHQSLVDARVREQVTLIGSGGIVQAEHVPKAILCGLDVVALDTALLVALQANLGGECVDRETARVTLPRELPTQWGVQRISNLIAAWRDQLLEVLGAMGLREVRRLRGESGRAMFQPDLEREAFAGIEGFDA